MCSEIVLLTELQTVGTRRHNDRRIIGDILMVLINNKHLAYLQQLFYYKWYNHVK
jgi:hypothetical protein